MSERFCKSSEGNNDKREVASPSWTSWAFKGLRCQGQARSCTESASRPSVFHRLLADFEQQLPWISFRGRMIKKTPVGLERCPTRLHDQGAGSGSSFVWGLCCTVLWVNAGWVWVKAPGSLSPQSFLNGVCVKNDTLSCWFGQISMGGVQLFFATLLYRRQKKLLKQMNPTQSGSSFENSK